MEKTVEVEFEFEDVIDYLESNTLSDQERAEVLRAIETSSRNLFKVNTVQDELFMEDLANNWDYYFNIFKSKV